MRGRQAGGARDLRTVLFTDIVGSTEHAARVGDRSWGDLLARHHALVRAALKASGGREMDTAGDGFFATFARPTEALACAAAIVRAMGPLDLAVRVGLHAGEVETRDGKAGGITVHEAARLMAVAAPDEVLVSATVRELAAGAGWTFADRGTLELKGLAEPVHAYALDLAAAPATLPIGGGAAFAAAFTNRPGGRWLVGTGAVVGLVVVLLAAIALAGGGGPHPTATPAAAAASASATTTATATASSVGGRIFGGTRLLDPDSYMAMELPGTPRLTVTDHGWSVLDSGPNYLALGLSSSPSDRFTIVWPPNLAADACGFHQPPIEIGPAPETQFVTWAQNAKGLQLSAEIRRQFGDLPATQYDVSIVPQYACQTTDPISVAVSPSGSGAYGLVFNAGERLRLEVSSRDRLILILIEAPSAAEFATFAPLAERILDTLTFPS